MTYDEIISNVSNMVKLPKKVVDRTYKSYWKAIREHITSMPLKEDLTDDTFKDLKPNVNIPSIGKLHVTLERYKKMRETYRRYLSLKEQQNKNATH